MSTPSAVLTDALARAWCAAWARRVSGESIRRNEAPYLTRYFLAGWNPTTRISGPAVFLHHFVASDPTDTVYSHPWAWAASLILAGAYREYRCTEAGVTVRDYHPGEVNVLLPTDKHRIELLAVDCWTLFLVADYARPWQFEPTC